MTLDQRRADTSSLWRPASQPGRVSLKEHGGKQKLPREELFGSEAGWTRQVFHGACVTIKGRSRGREKGGDES